MDELPPAPFERRIVGPHGAILLQMNNAHAELCAKAIQRRSHPAWSQLQCDFRVAACGRVEIPRDIAEQVLSMGRVEWGATDELNEAGHIEHLATSLRLTREHFNFEDVPVAMHGLYLEGTGTILCHTGTSPNSGPNAQALAGAWNWLLDLAALTNKDTTS